MNSEAFVDALKCYVRDAATEDVISRLKNPLGRRILPHVKIQSEWYNSLSVEDMIHVNGVIASTSNEVLFGVLAVLDGIRVIDEEKGALELIYKTESCKVILNDPTEIGLHELLNSSN